MKMINTLARYPAVAVTSGVGTTVASWTEVITGPLEVIIMIGTAIIVVSTAVMKFKEAFLKKK